MFRTTVWFIWAMLGIILAYNVYAIMYSTDGTISQVMERAVQHRWVAFALGCLVGHWLR